MAEEEQVKWDRFRQNARAVNASPPEWPAHVAPISQSGLALLGLDAKHRLYWDGEPVEVGKPLVLTWWQSGLALVVASSTALGAWVTYSEYACRVGGKFALLAVCPQ